MTGSPWTYAEESQVLPPGHVTLVCGTTFAIVDGAGDIPGQGAEGIFVADTRVCSVIVPPEVLSRTQGWLVSAAQSKGRKPVLNTSTKRRSR